MLILKDPFVGERFVSWAQNFEDVMLWRALKDVGKGFYIDVGAFSPRIDSVTQAFYEHGWCGINVEPHPDAYREFVLARPRDINLEIAIADRTTEMTMYFVDSPGLSTLDVGEATARAGEGHTVTPRVVNVETLASLWAGHVPRSQEVHFLKVDVEGTERNVLLGNDWSRNRPWIVVVEATRPTIPEPSHHEWEDIVVSAGYALAYADGLNRFYVAQEHEDLSRALIYPPNVFDDFIRAAELDAVDRASRAEMELATIYASRAWRVTAGVRAAFRIARTIRDGGRRLRREASRLRIPGRSN